MEIPSLMLPPRTSCTHCTDEEKRQSLTSLSLSVGFLRSKIESRSPPPKVWRERERGYFGAPTDENLVHCRPVRAGVRDRDLFFFLSLLSCCYEYMEENGEPFLRIDLVGSETGTPFSRQIPSRRYPPHRPTMTSSIQWRVWPLLITHSDCIDSSVLHKWRLEMIFRNCLVR